MNLSSIIKKYKKFNFHFFELHKAYKYSTSVQISKDVNKILTTSKDEKLSVEKELEKIY